MRSNAGYGRIALTLALVLLAAGCRDDATDIIDPDAGARLSVFVPTQDVTLAQQSYSEMTTRERVVIRSATEWPAIWSRLHGAQTPAPEVVQPDFDTEMAVVAAMGEKPTGGFDIVIDSVTRHERGAITYVTERSPGPGCMTTQALTQPVHAVRAPKTDGTIWWREQSVVEDC
jgi:hypothetical protein